MRLGLGVDGQDGVAQGNAVLDGQLHQPVIGVVADDVVVRGVAADHAAERHATIEAGVGIVGADQAGFDGLRQRQRNLERAGHDDALETGACGLQLGDGADCQLLADALVVAGLDDQDVRTMPVAGWQSVLGSVGLGDHHASVPIAKCAG